MSSFVILFLEALLFTISAELACGIAIRFFGGRLGFSYLKKIKLSDYVFGIIFASLMTLPFVWFVFYDLIKDRATFAIVSELWAWLSEAVFYRYFFRIGITRALVFSLVLNFFSFAIGLLIFG